MHSKPDEPSQVIVNGRRLTASELEKWRRDRQAGDQRRFKEMLESRRAPGGHAPYWGTGHESLSASVPSHAAREHSEWIRSRKLTGVEVKPDGVVVTHSPRDRERYLSARGLVDASSSGSGTGGHLTRNEEIRSRTKRRDSSAIKNEVKAVAASAVQDPEIQAIFSRSKK